MDSYVEDTPDLLRIFHMENEQRRQPAHSFPVTVDVTALYTNIPTHGSVGGLQAMEIALQRRTIEENKKFRQDFWLI